MPPELDRIAKVFALVALGMAVFGLAAAGRVGHQANLPAGAEVLGPSTEPCPGELNAVDPQTFCTPGEKGYTDYPALHA